VQWWWNRNFHERPPPRHDHRRPLEPRPPLCDEQLLHRHAIEVHRAVLARRRAGAVEGGDAVESLRRGKDWQFAIGGSAAAITPEDVAVPFGRDKAGTMLSDHFGYIIHYRIAPRSGPFGGMRQLAALDPNATSRR